MHRRCARCENCLDKLDPPVRMLCWRHFVEGASKRSLARSLERPESTVRARIAGALQQLRACLTAKGLVPTAP